MTSLLAVVTQTTHGARPPATPRIDLAHNGRRFRSRFCPTAGDQSRPPDRGAARARPGSSAARKTPKSHLLRGDGGGGGVRAAFAIVLHVGDTPPPGADARYSARAA